MTTGLGMGSIFWTNLGDTTCKWSLTNKTTAAVNDIDADADRKLPKDDKRRKKTVDRRQPEVFGKYRLIQFKML